MPMIGARFTIGTLYNDGACGGGVGGGEAKEEAHCNEDVTIGITAVDGPARCQTVGSGTNTLREYPRTGTGIGAEGRFEAESSSPGIRGEDTNKDSTTIDQRRTARYGLIILGVPFEWHIDYFISFAAQ